VTEGAAKTEARGAALGETAYRTLRPFLLVAVFFTLFINIIMLVSPIYMLQVYDRVLTAGSIDTLVWISVIALALLGLYAIAEGARRRSLALGAAEIEREIQPAIISSFLDRNSGEMALPSNISDLRRIQGIFNSGALSSILDAPFTPIFFVLLFIVHPILGLVGLAGALALIVLAIIGQRLSSAETERAECLDSQGRELSMGMSRQRSAIVAMGMGDRIASVFQRQRDAHQDANLNANCGDGYTAGVVKSVRQMLQIAVLGIGAALALNQEISAGAIVAASILMGRALAPVDQLVGGWRNISGAMIAWRRLQANVPDAFQPGEVFHSPRPDARLEIKDLSVRPPGAQHGLIAPFTIALEPGSLTVLLGPNGAGKSSILKMIAGVWLIEEGEIRLGGRDIRSWPAADRGRFVGYVPQEIELLPGTVKDNIGRFDPEVDDEVIVEAARTCAAHDTIMRLPEAYDTRIGPGGLHLSPGQAQLIALSRAVAGNPVVVILDEPTANLDHRMSHAVVGAIQALAASGATVVVSTHDIRLIRASSNVLAIDQGRILTGAPEDFLRANQTSDATPPSTEAASA